MGDLTQQPIGINLMQLTIASQTEMVEQAKQLIDRVQQEEIAPIVKTAIIERVTTIAIYKFSTLSREEVEAMLGQSLEETRVYRDAKAEGQREKEAEMREVTLPRVYQEAKAEGQKEKEAEMLRTAVPLLLQAGMSVEQIAQQFNVEIAAVQQAAQ